jgi:hypothetical protein
LFAPLPVLLVLPPLVVVLLLEFDELDFDEYELAP